MWGCALSSCKLIPTTIHFFVLHVPYVHMYFQFLFFVTLGAATCTCIVILCACVQCICYHYCIISRQVWCYKDPCGTVDAGF
jgi:hypothetical protein